ncbi:effector-associated domain 2-containing protein [Actinophytocola oryzae]|uniref:Effector-associated domain-containing protein n=1 Tax=Actinophytocola oryzae TaxID=502181 RepID=A0A4R7VVF1_9PSEU|nr:hypothetical protein [Actinophytocola oryzae]TDV53598.1 hypothetical protein CLV71_10466 [Actinophytocola oryzae]
MDRTRPNRVTLRDGMYEAVEQAFAAAGIPWERCFRQDVGDSILALVPAEVPKGAFAGRLPTALVAALGAHNEVHPPEERIRLRMALHAGEVTYDDHGVTATAIIHACRLLDAPPLKEALARSSGTLAVIASEWFFTEVIRHHAAYAPNEYLRVPVDVKETSCHGWIRLPDHGSAHGVAVPPQTAPSVERPVAMPDERQLFVVPVIRPASPEFWEFVDVLETIPCMKNEHLRSQVVEDLRFSGMIRYFGNRRAHVMSILRTCLDFENGVVELVQAIMNQESVESVPLRHLLSLGAATSR